MQLLCECPALHGPETAALWGQLLQALLALLDNRVSSAEVGYILSDMTKDAQKPSCKHLPTSISCGHMRLSSNWCRLRVPRRRMKQLSVATLQRFQSCIMQPTMSLSHCPTSWIPVATSQNQLRDSHRYAVPLERASTGLSEAPQQHRITVGYRSAFLICRPNQVGLHGWYNYMCLLKASSCCSRTARGRTSLLLSKMA